MKKKIQTNSFLFLIICTIPFLEYSISNIQELSYFLYIDLFIILFSTILIILLISSLIFIALKFSFKKNQIGLINISIIFSFFLCYFQI